MSFITLHDKSGTAWYIEPSHISAIRDLGDSTDIYLDGDPTPISVTDYAGDILQILTYEK